MIVLAILFWVAAGLLVYTQVGYGLLLAGLVWLRDRSRAPRPARGVTRDAPEPDGGPLPVSVIVAAYREEAVIAARVENLRALVPPAAEIIVAVDGGAGPDADATARRAREAGADRVLELPRGGKVATQNAAARTASQPFLAFSDANARWEPDALERLHAVFIDPEVGYVCGSVSFLRAAGGTNQEGLYWRYEMWIRAHESRLASITAGNGAIYMTRRESYVELGPQMGHDISFPFSMVKRGWRALYAPEARAVEKMTPSIEGEFSRKRRMAYTETWPTVLRGGLLSPAGYGALYALMIFSHRILRYVSPGLHLVALLTALILCLHSPGDALWDVLLGGQLALLGLALAAGRLPGRLTLIARYYVWTTASLAAGLWDWLMDPRRVGWESAEGTR